MKATLPRFLFIIILNILLYATLTFNINFSYLIVNLIIIFLFYELHIYKKIINKKLDELKKITDNNLSEILPTNLGKKIEITKIKVLF